MTSAAVPGALATVADHLRQRGRAFALVGGLAVSVRGEVRFTRDVDLAVAVRDDPDAEALIRDLGVAGYVAVASVEHEERKRLATVRMMSPEGVKVDLMFASCGIEGEIVQRATVLDVPLAGKLACARSEELVAMKILSMTDRRLQDRIDATSLLEHGNIDLDGVRDNLKLITDRGYHREQDLHAKLQELLSGLPARD